MAYNDYQFLVNGVIPATQESFRGGKYNGGVRNKEKNSVTIFKKSIAESLDGKLPSSFPTNNHVFVSIIQFYTSYKKNYKTRDVDNIAKTVLDVLKENKLYNDDWQVRTLLVSKIVNLNIIKQDLGFVYIKILKDGEDLKFSNKMISRAVELYNSIKNGEVSVK